MVTGTSDMSARGVEGAGETSLGYLTQMTTSTSARILAALLLFAGVMHIVNPRFFDALIPHFLPLSARFWTISSGIAEIVVGLLILNAKTTPQGGLLAALLFIAVFPGNLYMAWLWRHRSFWEQVIAYARLPLQVPLFLWALSIWRSRK
jgi:uncharacterized membrane protein